MTTAYSPLLKLALPVQGELSGTWGDTVNDNITSMIEEAVAGRASISTWTANSHVLTTADGLTSEARSAMLALADGAGLTAAGTVICPTSSKVYIVKNGTSYVITLKTVAGTGIAIPVGSTMMLYCDGTNVVEGLDRVTGAFTVGGTLGVTGAATFSSTVSGAFNGTLGATTPATVAATTLTTTGTMNLPNAVGLVGRNAANNGNVTLIQANASDKVNVDPSGFGAVFGGTLTTTGAATFGGAVDVTATIHPISLNRTGDTAGQVELKTAGVVRGYWGASSALLLNVTDGTFASKMTLDASGNLLTTGYINPAGLLIVNAGQQLYLDGGGDTYIDEVSSNVMRFATGGTERMRLDASGNLLAGVDNTQTLGGASNRWSVVYAGTGTINTSDAREKTAVSGLTPDEVEASKQLGKEIGTYKWLAAVAEKGGTARAHIGMTVQRAIEIMTANNLEPMAYGFICYDSWGDEFIDHPAIEAQEATEDAPAVEAVAAWAEQTKTAGDRYGFRYDELLAFIAAGFSARLEALEAV